MLGSVGHARLPAGPVAFAGVFTPRYADIVKELRFNPRIVKFLGGGGGNGMHVLDWMAWFLYIMRNTVRIIELKIQRFRCFLWHVRGYLGTWMRPWRRTHDSDRSDRPTW